MAVELVHINVDNGLVKIITSAGVKHEQQYSIDAALAKVAEYMDKKYEIMSASGSSYVLKKPEGIKPMYKGEFVK
ncbi:hypothetical protein KAR91_64790 [Candidatus Pacearchaeota archaeon]|nr:hypothetical protein [Candidatus Pacearchaeota archaeon]